tara:strand:+ start:77 stop:604 length:528 start_codon:yes stop_codon:yes gene_type:complete
MQLKQWGTPPPKVYKPKVYDNFFPIDLQKKIFEKIFNSGWNYTGGSTVYKSSFWHVDELEKDEYFSSFLYDKICQKLNITFRGFERIYANGQTACQHGTPHTDDGDMTFLYYPNFEWDLTWDGNLFFCNEDEIIQTVNYKPNRAVLFPANIIHYASAPSRFYTGLRISLAYKLWN